MRRLKGLAVAIALFAIAPLAPGAAATAPDVFDAIKAIDEGNYPRAIEILDRLARQGNADAQNRLGEMLRDGLGVPKNDENDARAVALFSKAIEQGHFAALTNFAELGLIVETRPKHHYLAVALAEAAAERGYGPAQVLLGSAFLYGRGVPRDPGKAAFWLRRAAAQGNRTAPALLGFLETGGGNSEAGPSMNLLTVLPTSNLAYGPVDGDRDRDASGTCGKIRRFAEADVDPRLLDRLFDAEHEKASGFRAEVKFPKWREAPGREAQTRETFRRELRELKRAATGWRRFPPLMRVLMAHRNYYEFRDKDAVQNRSAEPVKAEPAKKFDFRGKRISLPRGDMNAVETAYQEAARAGFAQAQVNLAILTWCGQPSGSWLSDILAMAWLNVADSQGFAPARRLKTELGKTLKADQIALGYVVARDFRAKVEKTRWGTDTDRS